MEPGKIRGRISANSGGRISGKFVLSYRVLSGRYAFLAYGCFVLVATRVAKLLCIDKTNEHIRTRVRESPFTHIYPRTPSIPTPHTSHTTQQKRNKTVFTFEFRFSKHLSTRDAVRVAGIWVIQNRTNQVSYHGPYQEPVK